MGKPRTGTVVVVGASAGIGEQLARRLARDGRKVALLARRQEGLQRIVEDLNRASGEVRTKAYAHDVRAREQVLPLWQQIEQDLGRIDELHYVAGYLPLVELDEFDTDKDVTQFEINTLGCVAWVNVAASHFGPKGAGAIVGVSSVAQDRGRIGRPGYCASKAGMDTYLESIRNRLWRKGVQVTTIRPGFVDTEMTKGVKGMFWLISADRAADLILRAVARGKAVAYVPARWRLLMTVIRTIPSFVFRKLNV